MEEKECEMKPMSTQPVIELVQNLWQYDGTPDFKQQRKTILDKIQKASREELNRQNPHGWTALHFAVYAQDDKMAALLLRHGASPNIPTKDHKHTPLHLLLSKINKLPFEGAQILTDLLLSSGADPSLPNKRGMAPFDYLTAKKKPRRKKQHQSKGKEEI